jgi:hypothetical protein
MLAVGVALFSYFRHNPLPAAEAGRLARDQNYLLPLFIVRALPVGIRAIIVAAIFAAAISTLDGTLTALAQTSYSAFARWYAILRDGTAGTERNNVETSKRPNAETEVEGDAESAERPKAEEQVRLDEPGNGRREILVSKLATVFWGVALCVMAQACTVIAGQYRNVIDLALGLSAYLYGPLLGIFLLAFLPARRDDAGLVWAVPMTVLAIFGLSVHNAAADWIVWLGCAFFAFAAMARLRSWRTIGAAALGILAILALHHYRVGPAPDGGIRYLAYTWSYPLGTAMTWGLGYLLGNRRPEACAVCPAPADA